MINLEVMTADVNDISIYDVNIYHSFNHYNENKPRHREKTKITRIVKCIDTAARVFFHAFLIN